MERPGTSFLGRGFRGSFEMAPEATVLIAKFDSCELPPEFQDVHGDVLKVVVIAACCASDDSGSGMEVDADLARMSAAAHADQDIILLNQKHRGAKTSHRALAIADRGEEELSLKWPDPAPHHLGA